jgi:hypothetical protein
MGEKGVKSYSTNKYGLKAAMALLAQPILFESRLLLLQRLLIGQHLSVLMNLFFPC